MPRLSPGDTAPEFTLPTADGDEVALADLLTRSADGVIVYFYPAAATPGCTTEACDFRDSLVSLQRAGYSVVGISPDGVDKLAAFTESEDLTFPLASDVDHTILEAYGAWGEKKNYGRTYEGVVRSTVVVAPDGTVRLAQYNVKSTGHVARLRKELGVA